MTALNDEGEVVDRLTDGSMIRRFTLYGDGQIFVTTSFEPDPALETPASSQIALSLEGDDVSALTEGFGALSLSPGQNELFVSVHLPSWVALHLTSSDRGAFLAHTSLPGSYQDGIGLIRSGDRHAIYWTTGYQEEVSSFSLYQLLQVRPAAPQEECIDLWTRGYQRDPEVINTTYCTAHIYSNGSRQEGMDRITGAIGVDYTGAAGLPFTFSLAADDFGYHNPVLALHNIPAGKTPRVAVEVSPLSLPSFYTVLPQLQGQPVPEGPWVVQLMIDAAPGQFLHVRVDLLDQ